MSRDTRAFLKDTKHTLQLLKQCNAGDGVVLATTNVASLYTNIDHHGAIQAVKWALKISQKYICKERKCL